MMNTAAGSRPWIPDHGPVGKYGDKARWSEERLVLVKAARQKALAKRPWRVKAVASAVIIAIPFFAAALFFAQLLLATGTDGDAGFYIVIVLFAAVFGLLAVFLPINAYRGAKAKAAPSFDRIGERACVIDGMLHYAWWGPIYGNTEDHNYRYLENLAETRIVDLSKCTASCDGCTLIITGRIRRNRISRWPFDADWPFVEIMRSNMNGFGDDAKPLEIAYPLCDGVAQEIAPYCQVARG